MEDISSVQLVGLEKVIPSQSVSELWPISPSPHIWNQLRFKVYSNILCFALLLLSFSRPSYPERITGAIRFKCLAQGLIDRFLP
jgi:hypothetical protein